jgi:predicted HicB family RNase H-like nuclease
MPRKPKKAGRPRLPRGEAKAGTLRVRVTPEELRTIEGKAKATKQTVSGWIRGTLSAALNA